MRLPGLNDWPSRTADAMARVADAARAAGRWAGIFCADARVARRMIDLGYGLVTPGNDMGILREAVRERIAICRDEKPGDEQRTPDGGY